MKPVLSALLLLVAALGLGASTLLEEGEALYLQNKPREAGIVLEQALREDPSNERVYLYLGVVYEQLSNPQRSIEIMRRGLDVARELKPALYFNIGNNHYKQGDYILASEMYTNALFLDPAMSGAFLNRANSRLKMDQYESALADYLVYLRLAPISPQRSEVEQIIQIIKDLLGAEERERQEQLAKQKALMDDVLNSLKNASADAKNVSAGSEDVNAKFEDSDIED